MAKSRMNTRDMALTALFTALISVGAHITIPVPFVPITLHNLFTVLAGLLLGSKLGGLSAALYMVLGLLGLPVFTSGAGIGYVFQPTFGYILGFIGGAWIAGLIVERSKTKSFAVMFSACLANCAVIYAVGLVYYYLMAKYYLGSPIAAGTLMLHGFIFTLPGDILKYIAACLLASRLRKVTHLSNNQ